MTLHNRPKNRIRRLAAGLAVGLVGVMVLAPVNALAAPPSNDNFTEATVIPSIPYGDTGDTSEATLETNEATSTCSREQGRTVWYRYTASANGSLRIDTFGSTFDTVLAVWTQDALGNLDEVSCNDDGGGPSYLQSEVVVPTDPGETYFFQISGYNGRGGSFAFNLAPDASGAISGTVTSSAGGALRQVCVDVIDADLEDWVGFGYTNSLGNYTVGGLPDGRYRIEFRDCRYPHDHQAEWYDNQASYETAADVDLTGNQHIRGIDAELLRMTEARLSVWVPGWQGGDVTSEPAGIDCGEDCEEVFPIDSTVTLTAIPHEGWEFFEWEECDVVQADRCTMQMNGGREVTASFVPNEPGPHTQITGGPWSPWSGRSATFSFRSGPDGVSYTCALDGEAPAPCTSPITYSDLPDGSHRFQVAAVDSAGVADPSPATWEWEIDLTPPEITLYSTPREATSSTNATFLFAANEENVEFSCRIDDGPMQPCTSPATYSELAEGWHSFVVSARDEAWNSSVEWWGWTVDLTSPETRILSAPSGSTPESSATFEFESSEWGSTFECSLDSEAFAPCTSPASYEALTGGNHVFRVAAIDAAGNNDPSPEEATWVVESELPQTTIDSGPSGTSTSPHATFSFGSTKPSSTFECSIDGKAFEPCTSPRTYSALEEGPHAFRVQATDEDGQIDPSPAERTWVVDALGPAVSIQRPTAGLYVNNESVGGTGPIVVVGSVKVEATAIDPQSGVSAFQFEVDGIPLDPTAMTRQGDTYRFTYIPVTPGEHTIGLRATNGSGLQSSMTIDVIGVPAG